MATYASAMAERRRLMGTRRITSRVVKDGPDDDDWDLEVHDARLEEERPALVTSPGWTTPLSPTQWQSVYT